jgi:alpha-L-fucosidase
VNGDAIYGTRSWKICGEGPTKVAAGQFHNTETQPYTAENFQFTVKGNAIYALELAWPTGGKTVIHLLGTNAAGGSLKIRAVSLLDHDGVIQFQQEPDGLHLSVPGNHTGKYAFAYKIDTDGAPAATSRSHGDAIAPHG